MAAKNTSCCPTTLLNILRPALQEQRREDFWRCRRSLRLWPIEGASRDSLDWYLTERLGLSRRFVEEEMGEVEIKQHRDPKLKYKDETMVLFEVKEVRNAVKAQASNLANHRDKVGMRLEVPNHLQKEFKLLMNTDFDLKRKHKDMKRNVKFDEDEMNMFMDVQLRKDGAWNRIKPDQAKGAGSRLRTSGPTELKTQDIIRLMDEGEDEDEV